MAGRQDDEGQGRGIEIRVEDLPRCTAALAAEIGLAAVVAVHRRLGNSRGRIFIPGIKSIERKARNRTIRREFTGANHEELAARYRLTTRHIRSILEG